MTDRAYNKVDGKWVEFEHRPTHEPNESPTREKLIESLDLMEECSKIVEIESKSWHDFWVVHRQLVRAMWLVLMWIVKQIDRKDEVKKDVGSN